MQEVSSLPLQPPAMPFGEFLEALFHALEREAVRPCILRNYEGFPATNVSNDVDFLIHPFELPNAIRALRGIPGIRIVGYAEREYVAHVFVEGIFRPPKIRALQVDFIWSLCWKGLPYLRTDADAVFQSAIPWQAGNLDFLVPSPVHEAIISLFSSLLVATHIKEKYLPRVQRTFIDERPEAIAALLPAFGLKAATRLVDSVIGGDREKIQHCVPSLRLSLAFRSLSRQPIRSARAVTGYFKREFAVRFSPKNLETICIFGPHGCGKTTIIEGLMPILQSSAKIVEKRDLNTRLLFGRASLGEAVTSGSRAKLSGRSLVSMTMLVAWLVKEWLSHFSKKQSIVLRIDENSCHDLFIHSERHSYGGPVWFARLLAKLFPSPDLWILLDPAVDGLHSKSQDIFSEETIKQHEAYRSFAKTKKQYVIFDASKSPASVTEEAYAAIIDALAQRTERQIKSRF
jgi:thymidylate kinase